MRENIIILFLFAVFCAGSISAQTEEKIAYGILLDNTGSLRTQFANVKNVGKTIVQEVILKGSIALFNFASGNGKDKVAEIKLNEGWSRDEKSLWKNIDELEVVGGQTTLNDAILLIAKVVNSKTEREKDKFSSGVLILITDGEERASNTKQKELIKYLKEKKIKVYAVGLIEELSSESGLMLISPQAEAKDFLKKVTKETGGKVVFPKIKQKIEEVIKDLFAENTK